tara:strand:- start:436 stop:642 length:207 start_codon:yes stop_codon:yes gene_type:complete
MTSKQYAFISDIKYIKEPLLPKIKQIKRVLPSHEEIKVNRRARSAVLRVGELARDFEYLENSKKQKNK